MSWHFGKFLEYTFLDFAEKQKLNISVLKLLFFVSLYLYNALSMSIKKSIPTTLLYLVNLGEKCVFSPYFAAYMGYTCYSSQFYSYNSISSRSIYLQIQKEMFCSFCCICAALSQFTGSDAEKKHLHGTDLSFCPAGWEDQHQLHRDSTPRGTQMLPSGNTMIIFQDFVCNYGSSLSLKDSDIFTIFSVIVLIQSVPLPVQLQITL